MVLDFAPKFPSQQLFESINSVFAAENAYDKILHLTANENILSPLALRFLHSSLGCRYNMGSGNLGVIEKGGNFAAKGMPEVAALISSAQSALMDMIKAECVTLNCLSGVHAMMSAILSLTGPGDLVMSVLSTHGGHFCTKGLIESTGRRHAFMQYNHEYLSFDIEQTAQRFRELNAKVIYLDCSVYLKPHALRELRLALGNKAIIIYDASHTLGLILGGQFQSPLQEGADAVCANTHKTLPGPHRGIVAYAKAELGQPAINFIHSTLVSSVHTNSLLALSATLLEFKEYGTRYACQIIENANALGSELELMGQNVRKISSNRYSENHQIHVFVQIDRFNAISTFLANNISLTTSKALGNELFLRLGVQEVTKRGMKNLEMKTIAKLIYQTLAGRNVKEDVIELMDKYRQAQYCFDFSNGDFLELTKQEFSHGKAAINAQR